ncbi:MFS transporter [Acrocarpospora corrugata]|uniref:MFS transporter n=1 Tax=Acrocarpospora corrugata TaxID=35763 RepID=UPI001C3F5C62|nr:MFS transporter [Acrocarpospora corrugata]
MAAFAHLFAGGSVSGPMLVIALGLGCLTALPLAGREHTLGVILPLLVGLQAVLHVMFSLAHAIPGAHHAHAGLVPGLGMLVLHGWAAGLTALWLARGERVLWELLRRLLVRLTLVILSAQRFPEHPTATPRTEPDILHPVLLQYALRRRGPPGAVTTA